MNPVNENQKTDNQNTEDQRTGNQKTGNQKTGNRKTEKYRPAFFVVSILLIASLLAHGLFWARAHRVSNQPEQAEKPGQSEQAERPSQPEQAEKPDQPEQAERPGQSEQAEKTGQSEQAEEPDQPEQAEKPGQSEQAEKSGQPEQSAQAEAGRGSLSHEGYTLEQVVVMSRHNIRSPMSGNGSVLDRVTPHQWFEWSSNPSELSLRGGATETLMGQYFRKWLEAEGLFPENYHPEEGAVRFYSNSKQRTIATTEFFMSGLLPTANMQVEYKAAYDQMDPVFKPQTTFLSEKYEEDVKAQIEELYGEEIRGMADNFELLADVIDLDESEAYKSGEITGFSADDMTFNFSMNAEPGMKGSFKTACSVSDALVLQYYEEPDETEAAFGHPLTQDQWREISEVKDLYIDILFATPLLACNVEHPILQEIRSELTAKDREFSFLCGHDSNISGIISCLGVSKYSLPSAIETTTPIGGKIVFGRWLAPDGEEFMSVDLVYPSADQLRNFALMDLSNPPFVVPLTLEGLDRNEDGLYEADAVLERLDEAIGEYDRILEEYAPASIPEEYAPAA